MDDQQWLLRNFGCRIEDESLLFLALSHRSVGSRNNERLEFLGDAVLGFVISEALYSRFPQADEGQLSRLRVTLVKGTALAQLALELDLGEQIRLGAGERSGGGQRRHSILADTLEALLGAVAIDRGIDGCREVILRLYQSRLEALSPALARKDPKTRLQEWLQAQGRALPVYDVVDSRGDDHARVFRVRCSLDNSAVLSEGEASSRRAAEQIAAEAVLKQLEEELK